MSVKQEQVNSEIKQPPEDENKSTVSESEEKTYIYLGPNIPGGILYTGTLFIGQKPMHLKNLFEKIPEIEQLFVTVEDSSAFKIRLREKGSEEHRLYTTVELERRKEVI